MDGWNFLDEAPVVMRNVLRGDERFDRERDVSQFAELRAVIVDVLRKFPDAYLAVIERLERIPLGCET